MHVKEFFFKQARGVSSLRVLLRVVFAWVMLFCALGVTPTLAQNISAVGDGRTLWIVQSPSETHAPATTAPTTQPTTAPSIPSRTGLSGMVDRNAQLDSGPQVVIFNRRESDPAGRIYRVITLRGSLANSSAVAANDALWLVFKDMSVVSLRYWPNRRASGTLCETRAEPALPRAAQLLSMTAGALGSPYVWALLRIENGAALEQIDQTNPAKLLQRPSSESFVMPSDARSGLTQPATLATTTAATIAATQPVRADRLMVLRRNQWLSVPLPADWPEDYLAARIVAPATGVDWPQIIVEPRTADHASTGITIWVYRVNSNPDGTFRWERKEHLLANANPVQLTFEAAVVEGQIVIAHRTASTKPFDTKLWVLRPEQVSLLDEKVTISGSEAIGWHLAPAGQSAALITGDLSGGGGASGTSASGTSGGGGVELRWQRISLNGRLAAREPTLLTEGIADPLSQSADYLVMIAVLVVATVVLLLFWKRDQSQADIDLPKDMELADFRRIASGLVDLLPCIFIAAQLYDLDPTQMLASWPGRSGSWQALEPGALALLFYVIHTFLFEILFSRSLGKFIFGLRVVNFKGQRPLAWQIIVRNLLKPLDLIAWPLLLMPLLGAYRQRLCDLVARTLVVVPADTDDEEENERDDHDDSSE